MNERIQLLAPRVTKDKIGNHFNDWHQIYECAAQVSEIRPGEKIQDILFMMIRNNLQSKIF